VPAVRICLGARRNHEFDALPANVFFIPNKGGEEWQGIAMNMKLKILAIPKNVRSLQVLYLR
jgi:hypothetical protein